jgi:hypothetical protein
MARDLLNVPNIEAATPDYPNGRVRDKAGATPGTTYSEILHGDIIQFFQKLMIDAGLSPDNNPDNVSNGYQFIEALIKKVNVSTLRASNKTLINSSIDSTEKDLISFIPDAVNDWDDLKITFSSAIGTPGTGGTFTATYKIWVNGVLKNQVGINIVDTDGDETIVLMDTGIPYVAGEVVKVTGVTSSNSANVGGNSILIVEGVNN